MWEGNTGRQRHGADVVGHRIRVRVESELLKIQQFGEFTLVAISPSIYRPHDLQLQAWKSAPKG